MTNRSTVLRIVLGCLIALTTLSAASADLLKPLEVNAIPAAPPDHTLAYGNDANQFGQLFLPQGRG